MLSLMRLLCNGAATLGFAKHQTPSGRGAGAEGSNKAKSPPHTTAGAVRETIESVVIAFVLAFLFRTFEAEAFVIPTGSMAPTLMGRHKDLDCPACGYRYQVSASDEVDQGTGRLTGQMVVGGTCPMCRQPADLSPQNPQRESYPSYSGDRILAVKYAYQMRDPQRWDVAVFRYPGDAQTNFIKRLVGLPGETLRIQYGDIFLKQSDGNWTIARKPPDKLRAMLQLVYDNGLTPRLNGEFGWPARWIPDAVQGDGAFQLIDQGRAAETNGRNDQTAWLRYHHLIPTADQWHILRTTGALAPGDRVRPSAIDDFCSYNSNRSIGGIAAADDAEERHWVGDLALEADVEVRSEGGEVFFELRRGGRVFLCTINLNDGTASLSISGEEFRASAATAMRGRGRYRVMFANCDRQLRLWINDRLVRFGDGDEATCYGDLRNHDLHPTDLQPASFGARGVSLAVDRLRVWRDIYYLARPETAGPFGDEESVSPQVLTDPRRWPAGLLNRVAGRVFTLREDQFLALGDNSAKSRDSRLWGQEGFDYFVRRDLLIGKALLIYWPHSWNTPVPFWPNVARMGLIR